MTRNPAIPVSTSPDIKPMTETCDEEFSSIVQQTSSLIELQNMLKNCSCTEDRKVVRNRIRDLKVSVAALGNNYSEEEEEEAKPSAKKTTQVDNDRQRHSSIKTSTKIKSTPESDITVVTTHSTTDEGNLLITRKTNEVSTPSSTTTGVEPKAGSADNIGDGGLQKTESAVKKALELLPEISPEGLSGEINIRSKHSVNNNEIDSKEIKGEWAGIASNKSRDRRSAPAGPVSSLSPPRTPAATTGDGAPTVTTPRSAKANRSASDIKATLLSWCQSVTSEYKNIEIRNFSSSWCNGLAFCALIHHFFPNSFEYSSLEAQNRRANFQLAFDTAEKLAGISPLLDVNDMIIMGDKPDYRCVFTYIQSLYRHLRNRKIAGTVTEDTTTDSTTATV